MDLLNLSFLASLPPIQSALKVSGNNDGMRIQMDIPASEVPEAIKLMILSGKIFRVTIEELSENEQQKPRKSHIF